MSLYEREYINNTKTNATESAQLPIAKFISQTYQLFAASLGLGAVGAYLGYSNPAIMSFYWGFVIIEFILIFAIGFKRSSPASVAMLAVFAFINGITISALISYYVGIGAGSLVTQAFILTMVIFGGLSLYAMNSPRDFTSMGKPLMWSLIGVVVLSLINIFFLKNPAISTTIAGIGVFLFSAFIIYDTQNIIKQRYSSPVDGALSLYLDFVNLFTSLLQVLGLFSSDD